MEAGVRRAFAFREESPEVYYTQEPLCVVGPEIVEFLKEKALESPRRRCRLCTHKNWDDPFQEMIIAHRRESYQVPHRHLGRTLSFRVLEGQALVAIYDEDGVIVRTFRVSDDGAAFYARVPPDVYWSFIIESEWFVILEAVIGPFTQHVVEWATWAPDESDTAAATEYRRVLRERALAHHLYEK